MTDIAPEYTHAPLSMDALPTHHIAPVKPIAQQHKDDIAVDLFAIAMKVKMASSRNKGRSGWDDPTQCSVERLQSLLAGHMEKGDPVDVGNFAMMLFNRGAATKDPLTVKTWVDAAIAQINAPVQQQEDFDAWQANPYTKVLQKSIAEDYVPKAPQQPSETAIHNEVIEALKFYAEGHHFDRHDPDAWDTVSGEPGNFQEDEACTATVEDGSIAKLALEKLPRPAAQEAEKPQWKCGKCKDTMVMTTVDGGAHCKYCEDI